MYRDARNQRQISDKRGNSLSADAITEQMIINICLSKHYSSMWRNGFFVKSAIILRQCQSSYCASLPMAITPHNDSISLFLQMLGLK